MNIFTLRRPVFLIAGIRRRYLMAAGIALLAAAVLVVYAEHRVGGLKSVVHESAGAVPQRRVGLVLGCSPSLKSGTRNPFFEHRMDAAAELFKSGRVEFLLVSGDNHSKEYDESTAMKVALMFRGVPQDRIVLDYAGFSTLDSMVRAREVFGLTELCVVSQKAHATRAVYIARAKGVQAVGFAAAEPSWRFGLRQRIREALARTRTVLDVHLINRQPRFLGPRITIG